MFEPFLDLGEVPHASRDRIEVYELISSSSSTPIPGDLRVPREAGTVAVSPAHAASKILQEAGRVVQRLAFLPIDRDHESAIDALINARLASKARRPITKRI